LPSEQALEPEQVSGGAKPPITFFISSLDKCFIKINLKVCNAAVATTSLSWFIQRQLFMPCTAQISEFGPHYLPEGGGNGEDCSECLNT